MPVERLQKVLAAAGVASRRGSEELIARGRVTVDGRVAVLGQQVDAASARIEVDGRPIGSAAATAYLALHKPAGVTSTVRDRHAERTVLDLVPTSLVPDGARLYPVGRLDLESEGLILLTNDGDWAQRVLHPSFGVEREYAAGLARPLDPGQLDALRTGVSLDEGLARLVQPLRPASGIETRRLAAVLEPPPEPLTWYRAVLAQGWKRQLRRMFEAVGAPIRRLVRVRIGSIRLDDLPSGRVRALSSAEVRRLVGAGSQVPRPRAGRSRRPGPRRPLSTRATPAGTLPQPPTRGRRRS
jgi:23S rRNA pseudouridine2605 synthase